MAKKDIVKIADLIPDDNNFNKGSEFGNYLMEKSFRKFGAGRSILLDKNNRIISGNKSVETAGAIGIDDVQIVESDGKRIIAVKRMDIDLDSVEGRELALADNATAKANIIFDVEVMTAVLEDAVVEEWGINIGSYDRSFTPNLMPGSSNNQVTQDDIDKKTSDLQGHFQQPGRGKMTVTCPHCAEDFEIDVV